MEHLLADIEESFGLLRETPPALTFVGGDGLRERDMVCHYAREIGVELARRRLPPRVVAGEGFLTCLPEDFPASGGEGVEPNPCVEGLLEAFEEDPDIPPPRGTQGIQAFLPMPQEEPPSGELLLARVIRRLVLYSEMLSLTLLPGVGVESLAIFCDLAARDPQFGGRNRLTLFDPDFFGPFLGALDEVFVHRRLSIDPSLLDAWDISDDPYRLFAPWNDGFGVEPMSFDEELQQVAQRLIPEVLAIAPALEATDPAVAVLGAERLPRGDHILPTAQQVFSELAVRNVPTRIGMGGHLAAVARSASPSSAPLQGLFRPMAAGIRGWVGGRFESSDPYAHRLLLTLNTRGTLLFPGDLHTAALLFELIGELVREEREDYPVVLLDDGCWEPILEACNRGLRSKRLEADALQRVTLVASPDEALQALQV